MSENIKKIESIFKSHLDTIHKLSSVINNVNEVADIIKKTLHAGGKVFKERKGLPAIALTTDTSILTAVGNDYGFEHIFSRQVEALCLKNDVVIGISTSGNSKNVVKGLEKANALGAITIGLTGGDGGLIKKISNHSIVVDSNETARIQEAHILIGHTLCELIDENN